MLGKEEKYLKTDRTESRDSELGQRRIMGENDYTLWVAGSSINYITRRGTQAFPLRHIKRNIDSVF